MESLHEAAEFVRAVEHSQDLPVSVPEEIAWENGWITTAELEEAAKAYGKSVYGRHLRRSPPASWSTARASTRNRGDTNMAGRPSPQEHHRHGRLRLHRQQLRALRRGQPPDVHVTVLDKADLRRQPREHRRAAVGPRGARRGRHLRRRAAGQVGPRPRRHRALRGRSPTTTTPSPTRSPSCAPTSRAPFACLRP